MFELMKQSLGVYSQLRDEIEETIDASRQHEPDYSNFAHMQLYYYSERCQSVNLLTQEGKLWDGEILMRSAMECATRFIFVSIAEKDERDLRIMEYSVHLNEIEELQRSEKARTAADANNQNLDTVMLIEGAVLSPEREAELREKWPKPKRVAIKQKWSFSEMVRIISKFHRKEVDLRKYSAFLHSYGLSSHLIHADKTAMDLEWDRNTREPDERNAMIRAHAARLMTDQVSILFLCWRALVFALGVEEKNPQLVEELLALSKAADKYHKLFADSQRHKYEAASA